MNSRRLDRIFLLHLAACVPFSWLWLSYGLEHRKLLPQVVVMMGCAFVYLGIRAWVVLCSADADRWAVFWPFADVAWVTAILWVMQDPTDPSYLLYLLPISYAALNLRGRHTLLIVALAVLGTFAVYLLVPPVTVGGKRIVPTDVRFEMFMLALLGSLVSYLGREGSRLRERLTLSEYQRDIAAEMHDGIQADLVLVARRLDLVDALRGSDRDRALDIALEQRELARRALDELRFLIRQGRHTMTDAEFPERLRDYTHTLSERCGLSVALDWPAAMPPIPITCQHGVLRIIQEAVTNAVKHAGAARVEIAFRKGCGRMKLRITDDGAGFDPAQTATGFGLQTMRSRAIALGGTFRIHSAPGQGTKIIVHLPCGPKPRRIPQFFNHRGTETQRRPGIS